ncbi:hypothetical protein IB275_13560 [Pseudomonas sp. PDM21]|uniref:hypothetical protein n=1 Tax=Pseudomonas sp. PDM21 TaxID=2769257 RepID=UPI001781EDCF|nr:hypothetical protein [Pseudomonas sp. PDM21]MBD9671604.1 hypothetical protein [Pseudomonas sp. PDM21]
MNSLASLRSQLRDQAKGPKVAGHWRPISIRLDQDVDEFLNVGVVLSYSGKAEVRMLDSFDRIKCLYDDRIDNRELQFLLQDIESSLIKAGDNFPDILSESIKLGPPLFASGETPEEIVDRFFEAAVTLGRPRGKINDAGFRYRSTPKLKSIIIDKLTETLGMRASEIVQDERYQLKMKSGHVIEIDVPLLSQSASGHIVSAWYKSPLVVDHNLLQASADLNLIRSNTDRQRASLSVLVPGDDCGMDIKELSKHRDVLHKQLDRLDKSGIEILQADSEDKLAELTTNWWKNIA